MIWSYPWKLGVLSTAPDVFWAVGKLREDGVKMEGSGDSLEGAIFMRRLI